MISKAGRGNFKISEQFHVEDYPNVYPLGTLPSMKDAGLRIRVQRELRQSFLEACQAQDKPAAQVLREFMREYVRQHPPGQGETENEERGQNGN